MKIVRHFIYFTALAVEPLIAQPLLTYMAEGADGRQIFIHDGEQARVIHSNAGFNLYPTLSPDGGTLCYSRGYEPDKLAIVCGSVENGVLEVVAPDDGMNLHADFSGNGRYLAFSGPVAGKNQITVVDLERNRNRREIIATPHAAYFPRLSAAGDFVVFHQSQGDARFICTYDRTTKKLTSLTPEDGYAMEPSLSFDEQFIAYSQKKAEQWDLYLYDIINKVHHKITDSPEREFAPTFKPDGSLVFAADQGDGKFALWQISAAEMSNESYEATNFLSGEGSLYAPAFSGDRDVRQAKQPPMPEPARSSFGAAKLGNRVYTAGGHRGHEHSYPPESFVAAVEYFDLASQTWGRTTPLSIARQGFDMVAYGGYLYTFGGFTYSSEHKPSWKSLDIIERYDPTTETWEVIGHLPRPRSSHTASVVDGKVYLMGGWDSTPKHEDDYEGRFHSEIDVFDLETHSVTTLTTQLPQPLRRALSAVVKDGRIVLIGGISQGAEQFNLLDNVTEFNPQTGAWQENEPLPFATFAPATGVVSESLYVFGGMFKFSDENFGYVSHVYRNPDLRGAWQHTGRYTREAKGFSQVISLDEGTLGILGGHTYEGDEDHPVATFETFAIMPGFKE